MKKLIFLIILICSSIGFSQENKLHFVDAEFDIEVDKSVYEIKQDNSYYTKNQSSAMQFSLMPNSYDDLKKRMMESEEEGYKKEIIIDGVKILLVKTTKVNEDGAYTIAVYCKKINSDSTLVLNSFYKTEEELTMKPLIEKALLSAKIKE